MVLRVLYQFNEKYAAYAGVSITSLFEHHRDESVIVYVLGEELSDRSQTRIQEIAQRYNKQITILDTKPAIEKLKTWGIPSYRGAYSANLRLFIPSFLDEKTDRILYLDADTIINGNLKDFYEMDLGEKSIAMALDSLGRIYKVTHLGYNEEEPYFNSGVILFDLDKWRKKAFSEKIIEHSTSIEWNYASPDQDLINVVCKDAIYKIPAKYNFQPVHAVFSNDTYFYCYNSVGYYSSEELTESKEDVRIYHSLRFVGEFPWNASSVHPYAKLFDRYLLSSPWNDYKKKKAESTPPMKVEKLLYRLLPKSAFLRLFAYFHNRYLNEKPEAQ